MKPEIKIKRGVNLSAMDAVIWRVVEPVADIFNELGYDCVITSARRKPILSFSFHSVGQAIDFRANHIANSVQQEKIRERIIKALGSEYDVLLHDEGNGLHYHVEYDPFR